MKITSLLSSLITENARLQHVYDTYVKPNPKIKTQPGQPARGIMDSETLILKYLMDLIKKVRLLKKCQKLKLVNMFNGC